MTAKFSEFNLNEYIEREKELKKKKTSNRLAKISEFSKKAAEKISFHETASKINTRSKISEKIAKTQKRVNSATKTAAFENSDDTDDPDFENDDDFSQNLPEISDDSDWRVFQNRLKSSGGVNNQEYVLVNDIFKVPKLAWNRLFKYQQDGVRWLWGLHREKTGGLLGDEMGLGKTVQIISFLAGLHASQLTEFGNSFVGLGPTLILCPSTVLFQWLEHFHDWSPLIRVAIFHNSIKHLTSNYQRKVFIKSFHEANGILITTYQYFLTYSNIFNSHQYHYLILDEGHKIKNPQAKISLAVKMLRCEHRIVLTASPIQNNLKELWSLFDFIAPQKLAKTLQEFTETIEQPIVQSEYKNATVHEEKIGMNKTLTLRSLIDRHILRRSSDIASAELPDKNEQMLFCSLTDEQKDLYEGFLMSEHVKNVLGNTNLYTVKFQTKILTAITILRKICNHPCMYLEDVYGGDEDFEIEKFANFKRSGKMILLDGLLDKWSKIDRVLLFTQSRKMIDFLEYYLIEKKFKYLKMDGNTAIVARKNLINTFNRDNSIYVFLLTTRVGGLGINLTGANKVVIFDPDWNPAIDLQAKERACRIGQKKSVEIFRLITKGTIEEKIYQRQIWKQLISNKVLLNTKAEKIFKKSDLFDLFNLNDNISETTEILVNNLNKNNTKRKRTEEKFEFSSDQVKQMRKLAKKLSRKLVEEESTK